MLITEMSLCTHNGYKKSVISSTTNCLSMMRNNDTKIGIPKFPLPLYHVIRNATYSSICDISSLSLLLRMAKRAIIPWGSLTITRLYSRWPSSMPFPIAYPTYSQLCLHNYHPWKYNEHTWCPFHRFTSTQLNIPLLFVCVCVVILEPSWKSLSEEAILLFKVVG